MTDRGSYLGGSTIVGPGTDWDENRDMRPASTPSRYKGGMEPSSDGEVLAKRKAEAQALAAKWGAAWRARKARKQKP